MDTQQVKVRRVAGTGPQSVLPLSAAQPAQIVALADEDEWRLGFILAGLGLMAAIPFAAAERMHLSRKAIAAGTAFSFVGVVKPNVVSALGVGASALVVAGELVASERRIARSKREKPPKR